MSQRRTDRESRRQLGKFYTPEELARRIVSKVPLRSGMRVLEPSAGEGSFIGAILDQANKNNVKIDVTAVEVEPPAAQQCRERFGSQCLVHTEDFYHWSPRSLVRPFTRELYLRLVQPEYDLIIGNPPFGGTIPGDLHDPLDDVCGVRLGEKIKKESYSLFIVKSVDHLKVGGDLVFVCSDTFLTINTMRGLRNYLQNIGDVSITTLDEFSPETTQPMVVLHFKKTGLKAKEVTLNSCVLPIDEIERTPNLSWAPQGEFAQYFRGRTVGDLLVATSGMTTGNNELFVRDIDNGSIVEHYDFEYFDDPITLRRELERARNGLISAKKQAELKAMEAEGATRRNLRCYPREEAITITLPHPDYRYYNKSLAGNRIVYSPPQFAIYWKDDGDAVHTFKKNGNWYLHGVGGKPFFGREGITWSLVAQRLKLRYLPPGYILDSGAPCAFTRPGVDPDELYFLMAWGLTDLANNILKTVLNHTRNIQGKDFERLPYPEWVSAEGRRKVVREMKLMIDAAQSGEVFCEESTRVKALNAHFLLSPDLRLEAPSPPRSRASANSAQISLF
jgi:hypothetical protein